VPSFVQAWNDSFRHLFCHSFDIQLEEQAYTADVTRIRTIHEELFATTRFTRALVSG
jgi:hypothetical protein